MYPEVLTKPMIRDLNEQGFESLTTPEQVVDTLEDQKGTLLLVINSVCGCAAAYCRPGAIMALGNGKKPEQLATVFAGVDVAATAKAREYLKPYPPSSPSIALFKDGQLVHFMERHEIEGQPAVLISRKLQKAFEEYC